jgi:hypothetical protein
VPGSGGPSHRILSITFTYSAEERAVIAELNAARDAEYAEVLERLPELRTELTDEQARGNATYAEVEESEADLERFRTWLAKIAARDYFLAQRASRRPSRRRHRHALELAQVHRRRGERGVVERLLTSSIEAPVSRRSRALMCRGAMRSPSPTPGTATACCSARRSAEPETFEPENPSPFDSKASNDRPMCRSSPTSRVSSRRTPSWRVITTASPYSTRSASMTQAILTQPTYTARGRQALEQSS